MKARAYLGDSVYADRNAYGQVVLTTENGIEVSNTIYLEPEVLDAFVLWLGIEEEEK